MPRTRSAQPDTFAEIARRLGNVPLNRILWTPRPGTATEADQLRYLHAHAKRRVELFDGVLVEKPMGSRESFLAATLIMILGEYVRPRKLGIISAPDLILRVRRNRNRLPDVTYTAWANLPSADAHLQPIVDFVPDLCVEIISESNTRRELTIKRREYFRLGVKQVWQIDPRQRTVAVYRDASTCMVYNATDTLTAELVFPGWALPLSELFNDPQQNPRKA
jgi:Uma2 family endonuclease